MDDISNLFDDLNKVRDASGAIQGALGPKGVSINQSKSKYLIIGDKHKKQAGAELGQAQLKQELGFTRCPLNLHRLYFINFKFKIYMSGLGGSPLSSSTPSYTLPPKNHQADYPPATYWPYTVNFKLHLYFPGGGR